MEGCTFCIMPLLCESVITANDFYLNPRLKLCTPYKYYLHISNQLSSVEFFALEQLVSILANTTFSVPLNFSIPKFQIYDIKYRHLVVTDPVFHLNLDKMAVAAKQKT